jgi:hypothetical protein
MTPEKGFLEGIGVPFLMREGIKRDRKNRPLLYAMADRMKNGKITEYLKNEKIIKEDGSIDLKDVEDSAYLGIQVHSMFYKTGENEGFFEFTLFGFVMLIKNIKEITEGDKINYHSENAIYEIIDPDGKKIGENGIKGYIEASKIFEKEIKNYKRKIRTELGILDKE